jgi:predicted nucleic acid-binding protein
LGVVLDTNALLSGIAYPGSVPGKLITARKHGALDLMLSTYILDELRRVLRRFAHSRLTESDDALEKHISGFCSTLTSELPLTLTPA